MMHLHSLVDFLIGAWFGGDVVMLASVWLAYKLNPSVADDVLTSTTATLRFAASVMVWPFGLYVIWQLYRQVTGPPPPPPAWPPAPSFRPVQLDDDEEDPDDDDDAAP